MAGGFEAVVADLSAGGIAGAAGILSTQPLDTIRVRMQSSSIHLGRSEAYAGIFACARHTFRNEGLRGLYKGVASPTLTVTVMNAVCFATYEGSCLAIKRATGKADSAELTLTQVALAGMPVGFTTSFLTGPTELVKCVAQTNLQSKGLLREEWAIFRDMVREHGWLGAHGPCRGLLTTIFREVPSFAVYFSSYEAICRKFDKSQTASFFAGGFAGALAWSSIYPLDVIKTRWQTAPVGRYHSLLHCLKSSVAGEGVGVLFKGFGATMCRAWPQNAVIFTTYEFCKKWFANSSARS
eukprot:TRINITY_DN13547_c0_g1_i1.p1 TRINITY_DN13547_c0_g1~~TRINITY_DN13547_c0_g1_i1.p1  ORF type:complete len:303 (+),score=29.53 TRINITY_DN13547_c0_g1_i1:22-909(+)